MPSAAEALPLPAVAPPTPKVEADPAWLPVPADEPPVPSAVEALPLPVVDAPLPTVEDDCAIADAPSSNVAAAAEISRCVDFMSCLSMLLRPQLAILTSRACVTFRRSAMEPMQ